MRENEIWAPTIPNSTAHNVQMIVALQCCEIVGPQCSRLPIQMGPFISWTIWCNSERSTLSDVRERGMFSDTHQYGNAFSGNAFKGIRLTADAWLCCARENIEYFLSLFTCYNWNIKCLCVFFLSFLPLSHVRDMLRVAFARGLP